MSKTCADLLGQFAKLSQLILCLFELNVELLYSLLHFSRLAFVAFPEAVTELFLASLDLQDLACSKQLLPAHVDWWCLHINVPVNVAFHVHYPFRCRCPVCSYCSMSLRPPINGLGFILGFIQQQCPLPVIMTSTGSCI
jgi:hypothetical protein